jgi:membrane protease subunit HflC
MKRVLVVVAPLVVALAALVAFQSAFVVNEAEQVIITEFGAFVRAQTEPGLDFKTPFVQVVHRFDKRVLEWDGAARQIPTRDKQLLFIDTFARWRVSDPRIFYESVQNELGAHARLDDIIDASTRDVVSRNNLIEMVRDSTRPLETPSEADSGHEGASAAEVPKVGRTGIERQILETAQGEVERLGITILDVRIKRVKYVDEVQKKVFERMNSERFQRAAKLRSEGEGTAAQIAGEREKELKRIRSEAYRKVQELEGAADAEATAIYAGAYGQDADFYAFLKTLETYRLALKENTVVVLSTDSDLFRLLKQPPRAAARP